MELNPQVKEDPEHKMIGRIAYDDDDWVELTTGLPEHFSGREEDAMRWILAMKAYLIINRETYDDKAQMITTLNKMSKGRGATFTEGWYLKLDNDDIPPNQKTFEKLGKDFHRMFIPKDLEDQACQQIYSLSMKPLKGDFNKYASALRLAQA